MGYFAKLKGAPNKRYTGEIKQMVVETMIHEKLSCYEVTWWFEISGHRKFANRNISVWRKVPGNFILSGGDAVAKDARKAVQKGEEVRRQSKKQL